MEINIDHERKLVTVWLTQAEARDGQTKTQLQPLYGKYKVRKYLVAVFESGQQDLSAATSALLCENRKHLS